MKQKHEREALQLLFPPTQGNFEVNFENYIKLLE